MTMKYNFTSAFSQTKALAEKYELDLPRIDAALTELPEFKVTVPLVGGFSTGKSSLINALLGENLLSTNITPETAVPTEITSGDNTVTLVEKNGSSKTMPLGEFDASILCADACSLVQIKTDHPVFQKIPTVKLVDMPGFDSGVEVHNRAIDNYMPKSLAYILTVAAEEGTLRESIISFLNELKLYDVPVYVVITKSGKVLPEDLEKTAAHLKDTVRRFMGVENVTVVTTNAKGRNVSVDSFADILRQIQCQSEEIHNKHFQKQLESICAELEKYLSDRLKHSDLTGENLALQKQKQEQDLKALEDKYDQLSEDLTRQIQECIRAIRAKIENDLTDSSTTLEAMLLQGNNVNEKVNTIVRCAVVTTLQQKLEPQIQRYLRDVAYAIRDFAYDGSKVELDSFTLEMDEKISTGLKNVLIPAASALILDIIGSSTAFGAILGPIGAAVGALAGIFITAVIDAGKREKQESERRELARQKVHELISSVTEEASARAETSIATYINDVIEKAGADIHSKCDILRKALSDTEESLKNNTREKEEEKAMLTADLEKVRGLV